MKCISYQRPAACTSVKAYVISYHREAILSLILMVICFVLMKLCYVSWVLWFTHIESSVWSREANCFVLTRGSF